jgi:hypothetical protein
LGLRRPAVLGMNPDHSDRGFLTIVPQVSFNFTTTFEFHRLNFFLVATLLSLRTHVCSIAQIRKCH